MLNTLNKGRVSRRTFVKRLLGGSAALVVAGAMVRTGYGAPTAGPEKLVTSAALNLRSQPSLSGSVLLVIPAGAQVGDLEVEQNGFTNVSYAGSIGWAKSEYLSSAGSGGGGGGWQGNPNNAPYRGQATTSSAVNMRNGGGMNYGVKLVIPAGVSVEVYDDYANYFWLVNYNGEFGWVHDDFLSMGDSAGGDMPTYTGMGVTTTAVNLRSGAGTNYSVLDVVPEGAAIELYAGPASNWALVRYGGQFGYVHADYVASAEV
jgi:mannosyl-glycoprotein endo-beta-N-acetylglucosaminidase